MLAERENNIDLLKAFVILLVVLGHSIQYTNDNFDQSIIFRFIYSFHMPLFMFISGYLTYRSILNKDYIIKRFQILIIPFSVWLIIYSIFYNFHDILLGNYVASLVFIKNAILYPDHGGLWFLWVLFLINAIYYLLQKTKHKYAITLIFITLSSCLIFFTKLALLFGFNFVKWHIFFFMMGSFFKEYGVITKIKWSSFILLMPAFILLEFIWSRTGSYAFGLELSHTIQHLYDLVNNYLVAIISIIALVKLASLYKSNSKFVCWLSENTLAIYSIHFIVLFSFLFFTKKNIKEINMLFLITFFATLFVSILMILILKKLPFCEKFLFGRITKKIKSS